MGTPVCWGLGWPQFGWDPPPPGPPTCPPSIEIDQKLQEIMKQTGYLTIGGQVPPLPWPPGGWARRATGLGGGGDSAKGWRVLQLWLSFQRYQAEINDLENLGEMGSGTCGQVWKMRFRKTGHVIAVKVSPAGVGPRHGWGPAPRPRH